MSSGEYGQGQQGSGEAAGRLLAGRYRVVAQLGRGGMGVVWRAVDEVLGREVAVKELRTYTDADGPELAGLRLRMQREARAAARVRHPGVVAVHDVAEIDGRPLIVMELVDGPSLDDVLRERGTLDPREVAGIGAEVLDALAAAHRAGVLHRDVKPGNILLDRSGRVLLTDFGIAAMDDPGDGSATRLTRSGELVGSLDYLAPERAQGADPGPASDVWALGATLFAAVEGSAPFRRTSTFSTLTAIVTEPVPEPHLAGPLGPLLQRLLDKRPESRPGAEEARDLLWTVADAAATDTPTTTLRGFAHTERLGREPSAPAVPPGSGPMEPAGPAGARTGEAAGAGGATGRTGAAGQVGLAGQVGSSGQVGTSGQAGSAGQAAAAGQPGSTAPAVVSGHGRPAVQVGSSGGTGPAGRPGPAGDAGPTGTTGSTGRADATGQAGAADPRTGAPGPVGAAAQAGPGGQDGAPTHVFGPSAPAGSDPAVTVPSGPTAPDPAVTVPSGPTAPDPAATVPSGPTAPDPAATNPTSASGSAASTPTSPSASTPTSAPASSRRKGRVLLTVAAVGVVLVAAVGTVVLLGDGGDAEAGAQPKAPSVTSSAADRTDARRSDTPGPAQRKDGKNPAATKTSWAAENEAEPTDRGTASGPATATAPGAGTTEGGGSGGGATTPAASCHSIGGGRFNCEVSRTAKSYTASGTEAGILNAGTNYFYCQQNLGRRETYGQWTNVWWAKTDDDSGNTKVYVSDVYLKGGDNDAPVPGLPVC
ncbi:serine/threonine-protein kinase [Streptomyces cellulosae]|uniref:serine/threonine-protein kinase n=1 Tax=Streptomyces cellulosae TaxID=1968 RepID=UPI0004C5E74A|nr:serine/threonine-protein kinase [Streptomyces cellulosae]